MNSSVNLICAALLLLSASFGAWAVYVISKRRGGFLNISSLAIVNYILVQQISGIVHITQINHGFRGFYDLAKHPEKTTILATSASVIGLIALCIGCLLQARSAKKPTRLVWLSERETILVISMLAILTPLSLFAFFKIAEVSATLNTARIIALDNGLARYSFLSNWLTWVITLAALILAGRQKIPSEMRALLATTVAVVAIAASLAWTGGRSVVVLMALPICLLLLPRFRRLRILALTAAIAAGGIYIYVVSNIRMRGIYTHSGVSLAGWVDWEWGRFSIFGTSADYVERQGFMYGETLLTGLLSACVGAVRFLGLDIAMPTSMTSMDTTSRIVLGHFDAFYIVPGITSELYLNLGFLGIGIGCLAIGLAAGWIDDRTVEAKSILWKLLLYFAGLTIVFRVIPAESAALYYYLFYTGLPLIFCAAISVSFRLGSGYDPHDGRGPTVGNGRRGDRDASRPMTTGSGVASLPTSKRARP